MTKIKEYILREFGDHGADTLERYFAQIEYTAFWCIRMLRRAERIIAVVPEGVEDVVVIRPEVHELHQVKTRDESQGSWTTSDVLPILCKQYHHRTAFNGPCQFHFVSDQMADIKAATRAGSLGSLMRLKRLLEIRHDGQSLKPNEQSELQQLEHILLPKICEILLHQYGEQVDYAMATMLLHNTHIQTGYHPLRSPTNLDELDAALSELLPGISPDTHRQLADIYDRLLLLVIRKIIIGTSLSTRRIEQHEVLSCRTVHTPLGNEYPNLDEVPGVTLLDKKVYLGGFDLTEVPRFHRQKKAAEWALRRLESIGLEQEIDWLTTAVLDLQGVCRHKICREMGIGQNPGPHILAMLHPLIGSLATRYLPLVREVDEQFCLGILWRETDHCSAWWHGLNDAT